MHKGKRHRRRKPKKDFSYINTPLSYQQLLAMAEKLLEQQIGPQRNAITASSQALMGQLGGIAPEVEGGYARAAEAQSSFAKGYSDAFRSTMGDQAADVSYGTGGALPAGALAAQGAAQSGYARQLPGFAGLRGQQGLQALSNQVPKLSQEILDQLIDKEIQKSGLALNQQALGLDAQGQSFDQQFAYDELNADTALGYAGIAAQGGNNASDKQENRREAWNAYLENLDSRAMKIEKGKKNPNYNKYDENSPKTVPYTYAEAFKILWSAYGSKMIRRGFKRPRVRQAIQEILASIGIDRPSGSLGGVTAGTGMV